MMLSRHREGRVMPTVAYDGTGKWQVVQMPLKATGLEAALADLGKEDFLKSVLRFPCFISR